jgi:hypothetical protein
MWCGLGDHSVAAVHPATSWRYLATSYVIRCPATGYDNAFHEEAGRSQVSPAPRSLDRRLIPGPQQEAL